MSTVNLGSLSTRGRRPPAVRRRACAECGESFETRYGMVCSDECRETRDARLTRERQAKAIGGRPTMYGRRGAKHPYLAAVEAAELLMRDLGWSVEDVVRRLTESRDARFAEVIRFSLQERAKPRGPCHMGRGRYGSRLRHG